ncbi:hypothetical protein, partial [Bacteroides heparinolyticus]|uniref:hypothetical protein n=1 Tax=Prevotella heparinolytica TaxID=28113 RepID=UPI0035A197C8
MRGCVLSGGYFLNAPVYGGQAEESLLGRPPSPCLTDASLCRDRHKCLSRQTQASNKAEVNV